MELLPNMYFFFFITMMSGNSCSPELKVIILHSFMKSVQQELHMFMFV